MKHAMAVLAALAMSTASAARADVIVDWNNHVFAAPTGPQVQRTLAMVHIAMFDAINAIDPQYAPYLTLPAPPAGTSPVAAAAAAAHGVLVRLVPAKAGALAAALTASLAAVPNGPGKTDGIVFGISWRRRFTRRGCPITFSMRRRCTCTALVLVTIR